MYSQMVDQLQDKRGGTRKGLIMNRLKWGFFLFVVSWVLLGFAHAAHAQKVESASVTPVELDYSRVAMALEQAGMSYRKIQPQLWEVTYVRPKDPNRETKFIISASNNIIMIVYVLGPRAKEIKPDMYQKLVEWNNNYYFVKFAYDKDSFYLRVDTLLDVVDGRVLLDAFARIDAIMQKEGNNLQAFVDTSAPQKPAPKTDNKPGK